MTSIRLLRLPNESIMEVVKYMEVDDQIAFSLLSKCTKSILKSLELKPCVFSIWANESIDFEIRFYQYILNLQLCYEDNTYTMEKPNFVRVSYASKVNYAIYQSPTQRWQYDRFEVKEYVNHFLEVFNYDAIDNLTIRDDDYSLDSINNVLKGLEVRTLTIPDTISDEYSQMLLKNIKYTKGLDVYQAVFNSHIDWQEVLAQNLEKIFIFEIRDLKIDDILVSNCMDIQINHTNLTDKDLKMFIRLWKSGSCSRLKYLYFGGMEMFNEDAVFRGIRHQRMLPEETRIYRRRCTDNGSYQDINMNGFDISRNDGTKATVQIQFWGVTMVVW